MAIGDEREPAARPAFQSVRLYYFACYPYHHPVGNDMVWDIEFYGVRIFPGASMDVSVSVRVFFYEMSFGFCGLVWLYCLYWNHSVHSFTRTISGQ